MKKNLTISILLLIPTFAISQINVDKELIDFIKSEGQYVFLTDKENLPKTVTEYENEIYRIIRKQKIKIHNALVLVDHIRNDSSLLQIPIFDISGFKKIMVNQKSKDGLSMRPVGNTSGKDGIVVIDTIKKKAIRFMYYQ